MFNIALLYVLQFFMSVVCFPANWGDVCNSTEDCSDHRYVCLQDKYDIWRCACDKFHVWYNETTGCVQVFNSSYIINNTVTEEVDNLGNLEKKENFIFYSQAIAGLFILGVVAFATITVIFYCIYVHQSDKALAKAVRNKIDKKP
ncbi:uncharacterized protein LOC109598282 isoform X2 [Aethina tumida]|uniref:uncharacterized protein LOC109598282 isoform X2 n=1 Tax=Aethina tumida TaxID=116153 RepID=UPI00096B5DF8|nr:uncharacterized protein LOC109598282 isoform X2 [Aethina tumida]